MNNINEIWRDVTGFEGYYSISNKGNVKSLKRTYKNKIGVTKPVRERIMKPSTTKDGYFIVNLKKEGLNKCLSVHRLIALAFIPNPENKKEVNHINGNKKDNSIENLEWVTPKENVQHAWSIGLCKMTESKTNSTRKPLIDTKTGEIYYSITAAAKALGIKKATLNYRLKHNVLTTLKYHKPNNL